MTVTHPASAVPAPDVEAAVAALRDRGLRLSAARRLVLEALFLAQGPVTAEEVAAGLGGRLPRSDLASVYRNLETLERLGLVSHVHLGHGPGLYAVAAEGDREYLLCESCGTVLAVPPRRLDEARAAIRAAVGLHARFSHFPIVGLCATCRARGEEPAA
jgi:Fur family transcriptional regulator, ferric uptake regulator